DWAAIRARIAAAQVAAALSLRQLAAAADIDNGSLSRFLSAKNATMGLDELRRLAAALGIDLATLLDMAGTQGITTVPLDHLIEDPNNPRQTAHDADLQELAQSIATAGLLVPLIVRPLAMPGDYMVVDGHRRLAALRWLDGGAEEGDIFKVTEDTPIPVVITTPADETDILIRQLAANLARADMHPLDEGEAFGRLVSAGLSTADIASRIGLTQRLVQSRMALTRRLCDWVRDMFREGHLTLAHAETLQHFGPDIQIQFIGRHPSLIGWTEKETRAALEALTSEMAGPTGEEAEEQPPGWTPPPAPKAPEIAGPAETPRDPAGPASLTTIIRPEAGAPTRPDDQDDGEDDEGLGTEIIDTEAPAWTPDDRLPAASRGHEVGLVVTHASAPDGTHATAVIILDRALDASARFRLDGEWKETK
ncbi:ParB/RepB/Spo0J family partition protein, partial [Zavarzinia sp.]|uniref:ParB/RepB/Spo0J family partition protein n=1 Tax=Zavarzinia sp. TaxID=2027920 RepID=UPI003BB5BFF2